MPSFQYRAKQKDAQTVNGQIIAEDKEDAIEKINQLDLVPVHIEEVGGSGRNIFGTIRGGVTSKTLYNFSRQMMQLLKGGVTIIRALEIVARQQKNIYFRHLVESIRLGVLEGRAFSDCLAEYPQIFPPIYSVMVKAGEESGSLKDVLFNLAEYFRSREEIAAKVRNASIYPALMSVLGAGSVIFILTYVLPKLSVLYQQFRQELPGPTLFIMRLSDLFTRYWAWAGLITFAVILLVKKSRNLPHLRLRIDAGKLRLPLLGQFLLKLEIMRFCSTLELLLKNGVTIVRAVQLSIPVVKNELIRDELRKCQDNLIAGEGFGQSLKKTGLLPEMMGQIIAVGEESGNISDSLHDIAEIYQQETEEALKGMTILLEPLLIIIVGSVIGLMVMSMLLPIFQLDMMAS